jgi:hypothetical protein
MQKCIKDLVCTNKKSTVYTQGIYTCAHSRRCEGDHVREQSVADINIRHANCGGHLNITRHP